MNITKFILASAPDAKLLYYIIEIKKVNTDMSVKEFKIPPLKVQSEILKQKYNKYKAEKARYLSGKFW